MQSIQHTKNHSSSSSYQSKQIADVENNNVNAPQLLAKTPARNGGGNNNNKSSLTVASATTQQRRALGDISNRKVAKSTVVLQQWNDKGQITNTNNNNHVYNNINKTPKLSTIVKSSDTVTGKSRPTNINKSATKTNTATTVKRHHASTVTFILPDHDTTKTTNDHNNDDRDSIGTTTTSLLQPQQPTLQVNRLNSHNEDAYDDDDDIEVSAGRLYKDLPWYDDDDDEDNQTVLSMEGPKSIHEDYQELYNIVLQQHLERQQQEQWEEEQTSKKYWNSVNTGIADDDNNSNDDPFHSFMNQSFDSCYDDKVYSDKYQYLATSSFAPSDEPLNDNHNNNDDDIMPTMIQMMTTIDFPTITCD